MSVVSKILRHSARELTRLACILALAGLAIMSYSVIVPRPLPVILAMSLGHAIGAGAVVCYVLAVIIEAARGTRRAEESGAPPG